MKISQSPKHTDIISQNFSNINQVWATIFIEELLRHNIRDFCIAPGSRSTPLTLAIAQHEDLRAHTHFDERGLGFLALGLSQSSMKPVVIITTSGTAVANLYPAVIEARQSRVALIIISSDRPPELINCGANQAIDQHAIFANYPVFFRQIPTPTEQISPSYLLTTLDQGLAQQQNNTGPIHFNFAFSEPLYPTDQVIDFREYLSPLKQWSKVNTPFTFYNQGQLYHSLDSSEQRSNKKVIVIAGRLEDIKQAQRIVSFANQHHYPLLADIQSSVPSDHEQIHYYDLLLLSSAFQKHLTEADIIIQFGDQLVSKRLTQFIKQFSGEYWLVQQGLQCIDPTHRLQRRYTCPAESWIDAQLSTNDTIAHHWKKSLTEYDVYIKQHLISPFINTSGLCEIHVIKELGDLIPIEHRLFIGNSMPIRLADMFMCHTQAWLYSNRGTSGIDGLIATAIGVAKNSQQATTLLIGDTSFLYDLNSLAMLKQLTQPFIIIVINNDGGSIFNLLPVPTQYKQNFYQMPHGLTFADTCKQFYIEYYQPTSIDSFTRLYKKSLTNNVSLIEVCVKNEQTNKQLEQLKELIKDATF